MSVWTPMSFGLRQAKIKQWVVTDNDRGANGGGVATLPIAFTTPPFFVVANPEVIKSNLACVIKATGNTTQVFADASTTDYLYPYRILAIGVQIPMVMQ